jgi:tetratricopeptide (TPR) repeat protein
MVFLPRHIQQISGLLSALLTLGIGFHLLPAAMAEVQPGTASIAAMPPLQMSLEEEDLNITDDLAIVEAQAQAHPNNPEAQLLLGIAYSRTPHLEKAIKALQRAKRLIKKSPESYAQVDSLLEEYTDILAYRPHDPLIHYRLAFGHYLKGYGIRESYIKDSPEPAEASFKRAKESMERVIELDPSDPWARNYLGFLLVDTRSEANAEERLDQAIGIWEDSLTLTSDNPGAYFLLGQAYLAKGNIRKALQFASKGLEGQSFAIPPNNPASSTTP